MKLWLATVVVALVGLVVVACGESHSASTAHQASAAVAVSVSAGGASTATSSLKDDGDRDRAEGGEVVHEGTGADDDDDSYSNSYYDRDDQDVLDYGHAADAADAAAIAAAVRRYYATAARGDGAAVCGLVSSHLARVLPELYGNEPGLPALRGNTCTVVMSKVLVDLHREMSNDSAALKIGVVRVEGATGQVLLSFDAAWPNSFMVLRHERGAWRPEELLAGGLT